MGIEYRLIGCPGAGKTTALMERICDCYQRLGLGPTDAVVSSLTHTASNNLVQRNTLVDSTQVGTLHSLCLKSITHAEGGRFGVADGEGGIKAWNARLQASHLNPEWHLQYRYQSDEDKRRGFSGSETGGNALFNQLQILRAACQPQEDWPIEVRRFYEEWVRFKTENKLLDYTDMIEYCLAAHLPPPGNARVGFFDEVQDFTVLEMRVIRQWGLEYFDEYYLAGDDDQCLYSFAGANPRELIKDIEGVTVERVVLSKSWRLPKRIARAAENQLVNLQFRQPKSIIPVRDGGEIILHRATWQNPTPLHGELIDALAQGKTMMLLTPCKYMLDDIIEWLRGLGVPFHNPWRPLPEWNPLQSTNGVSTAHRLASYLAGPEEWTVAGVQRWAREMRCDGKHALQRGADGRIRGYQDDGRPLMFLMNEWFTPEACRKLQGPPDVDWYMAQLRESVKGKYRYPLSVYRSYGCEGLTAAPSVIVGTIHSVKGGEADIVVLFPSLSPSMQTNRRTREGRDAIDRMMYVGMTRARERLIITDSANFGTPYRFNGGIFTP